MKKIFFTSSIILIFLLVSLMLVLSTIGFETDRFNKFISNKITENNKDTSLKLEKIKFKFDIRDINLFLETNNPKLIYKDSKIPVDNVKAYLDFISLVKSTVTDSVVFASCLILNNIFTTILFVSIF